jgi:archaeal flagellar protein FlaJ
MSTYTQLTEGVGKAFVFDRIRPHLRNYLLKAGIADVPYSFLGLLFWFSILPVAYLFIFKIWNVILGMEINILFQFVIALLSWAGIHLGVLLAMMLVMYFFLDLRIFNRTKKMEAMLPEFLRMVSENLKGGMPFEKALWSSIRPEFGELSNEIRLSAKKVMTGQEVGEALESFTGKYDSPMLRRSFDLVIEGMKGGGRIAEIIDRVIETIEETRELKSEMAATNLSYIIFIFVIVVIVTPGLFTLSFQFLSVLQNISGKLGTAGLEQTSVSLPINFGGSSIEPVVFQQFSIYALLVISFFASLIISTIQRGSIRGGIKYIPVMMISSYLMYRVLMFFASQVFSGLAI